MNDSVIAGALFDFMGWLTSRKEHIVLSSVDEASSAVDAIRDFAKMRGLSLDNAQVQTWQEALTQPEQEPWCMRMNGCKTKCEDCPVEVAQPEQDTVQRLRALVRAQQITIDKLEQALAQPKQEPVAWITKTGNVWKTKADETDTPLYTTPPQRKPLTDEQIVPMFRQRQKQQTEGEKDEWYFYAWGVSDGEAAHGIKENT